MVRGFDQYTVGGSNRRALHRRPQLDRGAEEMTIVAGTHLGSYEVLAPIASGGMGEVYQAHDTKLGRDVAIKIRPEAFAHDPERLSRFQRESKMLASLNHPNIAAILRMILLILATPLLLISGDVLQHHLNGTRNGLYVDPRITQKAATTTHRDKTFNAPLPGPVYAQPLYVNNGPGGRRALIVATEQNAVLALDAASGAQIWMKTLG